jgi:hypothetical protein
MHPWAEDEDEDDGEATTTRARTAYYIGQTPEQRRMLDLTGVSDWDEAEDKARAAIASRRLIARQVVSIERPAWRGGELAGRILVDDTVLCTLYI